jgi:hypothetical protein
MEEGENYFRQIFETFERCLNWKRMLSKDIHMQESKTCFCFQAFNGLSIRFSVEISTTTKCSSFRLFLEFDIHRP